MSMLTPRGFKRKRYADIVEEMSNRALDLFGEDTDISERSPIGIFIRISAWFMALFAQDLEDTYNNGIVDKSEGIAVDYHLKRQGNSRQPALQSSGELTIVGEPGTVVEQGFLVETPSGVQFTIDTDVTLTGLDSVPITAVEAGANGNVPAGMISVVTNPLIGVNEVYNEEPTSGGRDRESDADAIARYYQSLSRGGSSTIESVRATLLNVDGVRDAIVLENDTNSEVDGVPPKSIAPFINGGTDEDIAIAIMRDSKAGGIQSYGTTIAYYTDTMGNEHPVGFTRPDLVDIYVEVELETGDQFPLDGFDQVRTAIIAYIGGQDEDAVEYDGLGLDQDVIYTRIISAIYTVPGVDDVTGLLIGTDPGSLSESNIEINLQEIAVTDWEKVVVS